MEASKLDVQQRLIVREVCLKAAVEVLPKGTEKTAAFIVASVKYLTDEFEKIVLGV